MRIKIFLTAVFFAAAVPTMIMAAQDWQRGLARGLRTFSASGETGSLVLVCDPDRVYNPDVSYASFVVTMPQDRSAQQVVFLAETGQQAAFDVRDGTATQQAARPGDWTALIGMIRQGGAFAVVTARSTFSLEMAAMSDLDCG